VVLTIQNNKINKIVFVFMMSSHYHHTETSCNVGCFFPLSKTDISSQV